MSGSGFPEGLCTLLVNHHAISQPSTASWRLAFSSQRLSGPCYSHCRVACMLRSNGSWGTCIPQGITTFLHYASRRNVASQTLHWVGTRRVAWRYVSSSPPFSTVRATFTAHGAAPLVVLHGHP